MLKTDTLFRIKRDIELSVGERVKLKANKGRKRAEEKEGIIEKSYPCVFIVRYENEYETTRRVSYSYTDVLTKTVELIRCKDNVKIQAS